MFSEGDEVTLVAGGEDSAWHGLKCKVISTKNVYYEQMLVEPLTARPDGYGFISFYWPVADAQHVGPSDSEVQEAIDSIKQAFH